MHPWRHRLQISAMWICALSCIAGIVSIVLLHLHVEGTGFKPHFISFNQSIKAAFEAKISASHTLFEYGIVMLVALWSLVILKENGIDIVLTDKPEIVMFVCSNILFLMFLITHHQYTDMLIDSLLYAGQSHEQNPYIPDPSIWEIKLLFWLTVYFLLSFLLVGVGALFSAYKLRGSDKILENG